ncbi:hypothetical protein EV1_030679 [Malus domestica]
MAVVRGFISKTMLQIPMLRAIQWKIITVRCASGDTRPGLSTGSGGQINESPEKYAVTEEEQNGSSTSNDEVLSTLPEQVENKDYNTNNNSFTATDDQPFTNDEN